MMCYKNRTTPKATDSGIGDDWKNSDTEKLPAEKSILPTRRSASWDASRCGSRPLEASNQLHVCGVNELIDRCDTGEAIASVHQDAGIARKRRRVAGDGDDGRHVARGECARLRLGTLARRIEDHDVEPRE